MIQRPGRPLEDIRRRNLPVFTYTMTAAVMSSVRVLFRKRLNRLSDALDRLQVCLFEQPDDQRYLFLLAVTRRASLVGKIEQHPQLNTQSFRQLLQCREAGNLTRTFQSGDVALVKFRLGRQRFLRHAAFKPEAVQPRGEAADQRIDAVFW